MTRQIQTAALPDRLARVQAQRRARNPERAKTMMQNLDKAAEQMSVTKLIAAGATGSILGGSAGAIDPEFVGSWLGVAGQGLMVLTSFVTLVGTAVFWWRKIARMGHRTADDAKSDRDAEDAS
ncbi:hypothetical protein [Methyloceanibacter caenitepidi]|uniref:Uncharacterized protein n=1 Tax=Methyloceanibacter caenitepidi TaxID=1384459 RepID=A0A0A8K2D0_9HYPH|nr:hypothetical protein [Methyloceanibacter caenitepidi]BAQ16901.1 hypothetical protein GL4_1445 [Methyloceanibacter caenitepidi]